MGRTESLHHVLLLRGPDRGSLLHSGPLPRVDENVVGNLLAIRTISLRRPWRSPKGRLVAVHVAMNCGGFVWERVLWSVRVLRNPRCLRGGHCTGRNAVRERVEHGILPLSRRRLGRKLSCRILNTIG